MSLYLAQNNGIIEKKYPLCSLLVRILASHFPSNLHTTVVAILITRRPYSVMALSRGVWTRYQGQGRFNFGPTL